MSAITLANTRRDIGPDGIRRYRTRFKVLVHSHNTNGPIDLSSALVMYSGSKSMKGAGQASLTVTGDQNWLNLIYPNDYINVYVDRGDGEGWVRLFFGFIDRIREARTTDSSGTPKTIYSLQCTDFQKALEKTQIYFNPQVAGREDFNGNFIGTPTLGGLALRTRGIAVNGTPADLVINYLLLLMGFGTQFLLPSSYNPRLKDRIRASRANFILNRLSEDAKRSVLDAGGYAQFLEQARTNTGAQTPVEQLVDPSRQLQSTSPSDVQAAERARFSDAVIRTLGAGSVVGSETPDVASERGEEAYNILNTTTAGFPPSLLDVMDIETFIERSAIDGYIAGITSIWEKQGDVMSFLRTVSNEIVNELFFDLRPVSFDGGLSAGTVFSRELDDIAGNAAADGAANGTLYIPSVVMREYPFSTIQSVDGGNLGLTVRMDPNVREVLGRIYFGALFSNQPNVPGRHIITIPNMNISDQVTGNTVGVGFKHLDVVTVYDTEISSTDFGRSDSDHFNLFDIYSAGGLLGDAEKFMLRDLCPIISPIHIVRHGLRTRELSTIAARFDEGIVDRLQPQPTDTQAEQSTPAAPAPVPTTNPAVTPVEIKKNSAGVYSQGYIKTHNAWQYRSKTFDGIRHYNGVPSQPVPPSGVQYWRFHNGVDIIGPRLCPVRAVRDGFVVAAVPYRAVDGYGNMVIIWHPDGDPNNGPQDTDYYTLYAHLDSIDPAFAITSRSNAFAAFAAPELISGGHYRKLPVSAGQTIGLMGKSGGSGANRAQEAAGVGVHTHFEVNLRRNGKVYPSSSQRNGGIIPDVFKSAFAPIPTAPVSPTPPDNPSEADTISQDPQRILGAGVWNIISTVTNPDGSTSSIAGLPLGSDPSTDGDFTDDSTDADDDDSPQTPPAPTQESTAPDTTNEPQQQRGHIDTPITRKRLMRWNLLQDHWYQHNLEYLSGTIEMRGAPEIRIGYRLDLVDRNMSFYVEGVSHSWTYPQAMRTTLQVTRGQPNNPYPGYVLPFSRGLPDVTDTQRQTDSRLSKFFIIPDPISVRRALKLDSPARNNPAILVEPTAGRSSPDLNIVDSPNENSTSGDAHQGLLEKYNESIIPAESVNVSPELQDSLDTLDNALQGVRPQGSLTSTETNPQAGIPDALLESLIPSTNGVG